MSEPARSLSVLEVRPAVLDSADFPVYANYLVDGRNLLDDLDADWFGSTAYEWTSPVEPVPLEAGEKPRRIALGGSPCDIYCCGAIWITLRREGNQVIWSDWENTQDDPRPLPDELRFDAGQYDAALARMVADHSWERPVDTVARLIEEAFCESGPLLLPNAALVRVSTRSRVSDRAELLYRAPGRPVGSYSGVVVLPLDPSVPPAQEAERLAGWLRSADPRELAREQAKAGVRRL